MSILSYLLGGVVLFYTVVYSVKRISKIVRFCKCKSAGKLKEAEGEIIAKSEEENKAIRGKMVNLSFPKFQFSANGGQQQLQWVVRYQNAEIGQRVVVGYCERTLEAWVIKDIPLMKRELIIRVLVMLAVLTMLALTEVIL